MVLAEELQGRLSITEGYNFLTDGFWGQPGPGWARRARVGPWGNLALSHRVQVSAGPAAWSLQPQPAQHLISLIWLDFFRVMYSNMLTSSG